MTITLLQRHDDVQPSIGVSTTTLTTRWEWALVTPVDAPHVRAGDQDILALEIANKGEATAMVSKLEVRYQKPCQS